MTIYRYKCSKCGSEVNTSNYRSWKRGLCIDCALGNVRDNAQQLHEHKGPAYERWRKAMRKATRRL